jgi:hypothetical protein
MRGLREGTRTPTAVRLSIEPLAERHGPIVLERIVKPNVFGQPTDEARLAQLLEAASNRYFGALLDRPSFKTATAG